MSKVTQVLKSVSSMQAIVTLDNGDRHAFMIKENVPEADAEILADAASGKLAEYLDWYESDTAEEIAETEAQASDWAPIYTA